MNGNELQRALREHFEERVLNHGDYSLVFARPYGPGPALVIGYRREPLELVLCPVDVARLARDGRSAGREEICPVAPVCSLDLTNVATVADDGVGYRVQAVTGPCVGFEVPDALRVLVDAQGVTADGRAVAGECAVVDQSRDAEDFHQFMGHFMDVLDAFYQVPDTLEGLGVQSAA